MVGWYETTHRKTIRGFFQKDLSAFWLFLSSRTSAGRTSYSIFRTNNSVQKQVSINVYDTILLLQQRQDWLRDYLKENEFEELDFVGKYNSKSEVKTIVNDIRQVLELPENWAAGFRTWDDALGNLVQAIEDKGIIAVFNGVVENNTSRKFR